MVWICIRVVVARISIRVWVGVVVLFGGLGYL